MGPNTNSIYCVGLANIFVPDLWYFFFKCFFFSVRFLNFWYTDLIRGLWISKSHITSSRDWNCVFFLLYLSFYHQLVLFHIHSPILLLSFPCDFFIGSKLNKSQWLNIQRKGVGTLEKSLTYIVQQIVSPFSAIEYLHYLNYRFQSSLISHWNITESTNHLNVFWVWHSVFLNRYQKRELTTLSISTSTLCI